MADVVVIGAGISGAATAYELAVAGADVVLIDRYAPAAMASGWTLAGVRQSGRHIAEWPLAKAAVARWSDLDQRLGAPTHYRRGGNLRCARNEAEAATIRRLVTAQRADGFDISLIEGAEIQRIAPLVSRDVVCGSFCATDGHADPKATVAAYIAAAERLGVATRFGERVLSLEVVDGAIAGVVTDKGRIPAGSVVVAAGVFGNELLDPLGLHVPFETMSATMIRSVAIPPQLVPVVGVANGDTTARQEAHGQIRFGGGHEVWDGAMTEDPLPSVRPAAASIRDLLTRFVGLLPAFADLRIAETWCGLIDQTPDAIPVIEAFDSPRGLVVAMGFSGHGFCLGPVTGQILSALALGQASPLPIEPFRLARFAGMASNAVVELHG
jgi:sarcosine oxidase subunit beta